ncbi:MAG: FtsX-like permease family protein [Enterococcus sp.]
MLYKLLIKSFFNQFRKYLVYFLSMTFAVMIYYSFRSITHDQPLVRMVSPDVSISSMLNFGSFMIAMILLFFMFSTSRFFFHQRKHEFSLYQLMGLRKDQVATIFFFENLLLGSLAILVGISLGIIYSKLFSMIFVRILDLNITSIFFVSTQSIVDTIFAFFISLLAVSVYSFLKIWRYPMLEVLHKSPRYLTTSQLYIRTRTRLLGTIGVLMITLGYLGAARFRAIVLWAAEKDISFGLVFFLPLVIFISCCVGTYLVFNYTMRWFFDGLSRTKWHYQGLHRLLLGNTKKHYFTNWRTLSMITIFLGLSLAMIGSAVAIATATIRTEKITHPVAYQVSSELAPQVEQIAKDTGQKIEYKNDLSFKVVGSMYDWSTIDDSEPTFQVVNLISIDDYELVKKTNDQLPAIHLRNAKDTVLLDQTKVYLRNSSTHAKHILLPDVENSTVQKIIPDYLGDAFVRYSDTTLVVSQKLFEQVQGVEYHVTNIQTSGGNKEKTNTAITSNIKPTWQNKVYYAYDYDAKHIQGTISEQKVQSSKKQGMAQVSGEEVRLDFSNRYPQIRAIRRQAGLLIYVFLFVGMIAVFSTGSILMVRKLAEAEEEKANYQLLNKLGISKKQIHRLIYGQTAFFYFPPMLLGILHAYFVILVYNQFIEIEQYGFAYVICASFIIIFSLFYVVTCRMYFRILED